VAVYPAPFPRPFVPLRGGDVRARPAGAAPRRGAVRIPRARPLASRTRQATPRVALAVTPLAAVVGLSVFASAAVVALVRAVALVPSVDGGATHQRRHASRARVGHGGHRVAVALAAIVVAFCTGLIYLDRSVQISARSYDAASLVTERDDLLRQERTLRNDLARLGSEVAVGHEALDQGLIRLGPPILVPAS
jgi:hypothetical protein